MSSRLAWLPPPAPRPGRPRGPGAAGSVRDRRASRCCRPARRRIRRWTDWTFSITAGRPDAEVLDLAGIPGAARRDRHRGHPLRDALVQARTPSGAACRWTRCWIRSSTTPRYVLAFCDGGYTTNLPIEDITGGQAWVASATTASRWSPSTAARPGCWCRTCTSGRAPNGCAAWICATMTSRASGRPTATTSTETHGENSGTRATDLAGRHRRPR